MKEKDLRNWEEKKAMGFWRYVLQVGVINYGIPMFIVMSFVVNKPFAEGITLRNASFNVSIWAAVGIFFGVTTWYMMEHMYNKATRKNHGRRKS